MTVAMQEQRVMISPDYVKRCAAVIEKSGAHKMVDFYFFRTVAWVAANPPGQRIQCWACLPWGWL